MRSASSWILDQLLDHRRRRWHRAREVGSSSSSTRGSSASARMQTEALALAGRELVPAGNRGGASSSASAESSRSELGTLGEVLAPRRRPTTRARPRHSARAGAIAGPASRPAPRPRGARSRRPDRGRRWRAAAGSCRSRTAPPRPGIRPPPPRRIASAAPALPSSRPSARTIAHADLPGRGPLARRQQSPARAAHVRLHRRKLSTNPGHGQAPRQAQMPWPSTSRDSSSMACAAPRPVGVHVVEVAEHLQRRLLLADLAQDLGQAIQGLEMVGVERQRAAQVAQARTRARCAGSARRRGGSILR